MGPGMTKPLRRSDPVYQLRATEDAAGFSGYAATFWRVDSYGTAFTPTAFTKTLAERADDVRILYQHNPDWNIGVPNTLRVDDRGLYVDASVVDDGAEGSAFLKRLHGGVPFGLSFGFRTMQDRAASEDDPLDMTQVPSADIFGGIRVITEVKLYEVSPVTFPANDLAEMTAVRQGAITDALHALADDLRAHRFSAEERAALAQVVAAIEAGEPDAAPLPQPKARRRDVDAVLAAFPSLYLPPELRTTA